MGGAKRQKSWWKRRDVRKIQEYYQGSVLTSIELIDNKRATLVWLIDVPRVGSGGFVGPIVPVAITPSGKDWAWADKTAMSVVARVAKEKDIIMECCFNRSVFEIL